MTIVAAPEEQLTIVCATPPIRVTGLRGSTPPLPTGGYGGWDTQDRPRRRALTVWSGSQPLEQKLSILFDGFDDDTSVESDCAALHRIARPAEGEPAPVRVVGAVPHAGLDWVISNLEWSDSIVIFSQNGYRSRQEVTVTLLEYVGDDRVALLPAAERARRAALAAAQAEAQTIRPRSTAARSYVVKPGDTLDKVAADQLGDYRMWTKIADLNNIRDPASLTVGQVLLLP